MPRSRSHKKTQVSTPEVIHVPKPFDDDDEEPSKGSMSPLCVWSYLYRSALVLAHHPTLETIIVREFVQKANVIVVRVPSIWKDTCSTSALSLGERPRKPSSG